MDDSKKDISQIRKYLNGELDARAMHQLEREAQDDPFLMDALDGFENSAASSAFNFDDLDKRLADRIGESKVRKMFPWKYYAAAASILLFFTIGYLMWPKPDAQQKQVADLVPPKAAVDNQVKHIDTITPPVIENQLAKTSLQPVKRRQEIIRAATATSLQKVSLVANGDVIVKPAEATEPFASKAPVSASDTVKQLAEVAIKQPSLPSAAKAQEYYGNVNPPIRGFIKPKSDTTLHEIVIPGLPKLDATSIASRNAAQPQTLDNKVKDAKVKTPDKGHDAMLTQIGLPIDRDMPTPAKKAAATEQVSERVSAPTSGQARGYAAGRADTKTGETTGLSDKSVISGVVTHADNIKEAHPKTGWSNYNLYVKAKAKGATGTVRLSFAVDAKGQLSDFKIVKGIDEATDKKAIDIIKNGPTWAPEVSGKAKTVEMKVVFSKE